MSDCIFCKINHREIPTEFIYSNDNFFVIKDIAPKSEFHNLIISKKHIESLQHLQAEDKDIVADMLFYAHELAEKYGLSEKGYKIMINTGSDGGQEVMHLHLHFLGGRPTKKN